MSIRSAVPDAVLHQLKVAAAIAVLRQKPAEADAYHYTKQLCSRYIQAQTQWRTRYFEAQDALLHLKQQQLVCLTHSEGSVYPPTPPSSVPDHGGDSGQSVLTVTGQQALVSSSQFIQAVVSLASAARIEPPEPPNTGAASCAARRLSPCELLSTLDSLLSDTVPSCVRHLREVVSKGDAAVSTHCIMQGLDGLILLLDADWMEAASASCLVQLLLEQLGSLIDDLLQRLFVLDSVCVVQSMQTRKLLHQMLLRLTTKMRVPEKYCLLHSLAGHAKTLCASLSVAISNRTTINPDSYEALGIALDCLQQGVASVKVGDIHVEALKELQQEMETVLAPNLISHFPLVAKAVLRLTSTIEMCCKSGS